MNNLRGLTDEFKTKGSPKYGVTDPELYISLFVATVLMTVTIGMMFLLANTVVAETILWLYDLFWFLGVLVMGLLLTSGWYIGLWGIDSERYGVAAVGVILSIFGYGGFGGAILSPYDMSLWGVAIAITSAISIAITIVLSIYIFVFEADLRNWMKYSSILFLTGIGSALIASFFPPVALFSFACILLGFILELGYEIWYCSRSERSALANGFAIYFAFAGVFVHILQIVLEVLSSE